MAEEAEGESGDLKFFLLAALLGLAGGIALGYILFHAEVPEPAVVHKWEAIPCKHCEDEAANVAAESATLAERRPLHLAAESADD